MSTTPPEREILKPYSGAKQSFLGRHIGLVVAVIVVVACLPYGFYYALTTPWMLVPMLVPVLILLALGIWALPDTKFMPDKALERMLFAYFAALILWPNYIAIDLPGLPWITMARIVNVPMVLLLIYATSTSPGFRTRMGEILSVSPIVWKALIVFVVLQTLSLPFSFKPSFSFAQYVINQLNQTAMFFICAYVFARRGRAELWSTLLVIMALIVGIVGFIEYFKTHPLWSGYVPEFLLIQDPEVQAILNGASRSTTGQYRTSSVFSTPLGLSEFLALSLPFMLHFASSPRYNFIPRLMAGLSVPFAVLIILYTDSRLGLLGLFLSLMFFLLYKALQYWRNNKSSLIPTAILVAYPTIFVMFVASTFTVGKIKAKVWGTGQYADSNAGRTEQLRMGIPKIITHPLGHGTSTAGEVLGYTNPSGKLTIDNYLLAVALDYGIIGLISFVAMFGVSAYTATRFAFKHDRKDVEFGLFVPLAITMIVFVSIKWVFAQDDNHPLMFMIMGLIAALSYRFREVAPARKAADHVQGMRFRLGAKRGWTA